MGSIGIKRRVSIFPESQYPDTGYRQVWSRAQQMEGRRRMSKLNSNTRVSQTGSMQNVIENFLFIICNIISLTKYAAYNGLSSSYLLPISSSTHTDWRVLKCNTAPTLRSAANTATKILSISAAPQQANTIQEIKFLL